MEMRQLRSFLTLTRAGSLTRVADEVHISPAAVYKQLKNLEDELRVRLYRRTGRKVILTPAGEALLPFSKSLLAQHDAAIAAARELAGKGLVRVGTGPAVSSYLLPALLRKYRRALPNVEVTVESQHTSELVRRLAQGSLDLVLAHSFVHEDRSVHVEKTWPVEFVLVSNAPKSPRARSLRDLRRFPFVLFRKGSETQTFIDHYFKETGLRPRVSLRFDNSQSVKEMVLKRSGLSILPFWIVNTEVRNGLLDLLQISGPRLFVPMALLSRKSNCIRRPAEAFIRMACAFEWSHPRLVRPGAGITIDGWK